MAAYAIFLWATYIDEEVTQGSAYGLTIGVTKQEAFRQAKSELINAVVYIEIPDYAGGEPIFLGSYGPFKKTAFDIEDLDLLMPRSVWKLHLKGSMLDFRSREQNNLLRAWDWMASGWDEIELYFDGNNLKKIRRFRKLFELP